MIPSLQESENEARQSALLPRIIDLAFEQPAMTVTHIAQQIGVTYQAAANNVAVLVGAGVASEIGSHPKGLSLTRYWRRCHRNPHRNP